MNARDLLAAATTRPWTTTKNDNRYGSVASTDPAAIAAFCARWPEHGPEDIEAYGGALVGESIQAADRALIVAAVNEYEALVDGEHILRGALNYFRGFDQERTDGRTSPVIPQIEAVIARLDALRADLPAESTEPAPARLEAAGTGSDRKDGTTP